jgi:hypothetical protein
MSLLGPTNSYSVSSSTAMTIGASDKLKELALRMLSNPDHRLLTSPEHAKLYVAVVQISCNPGKRTKQHYIADINATFEYGNSKTGDLSTSSSGSQPMVFSVLPLLDAQTLDLKNSQQDEFSLLVALMGTLPPQAVSGQLGGVMSFLSKYQRDSATKSSIPIVNSYTTGAGFGFRVLPSYQAIADPTEKDSAGDNVLVPTTFPAIVFLVMDPSDTNGTAGVSNRFDLLVTHAGGHWYRRDDAWFFPRQEEDSRATLEMAKLLVKIDTELGELKGMTPIFDQRYMELRRDRLQFEPSAIGYSGIYALPAEMQQATTPEPNPVTIETIDPPYIDPTKGGYFVISGRNLDRVSEVTIGDQLAYIQKYPDSPLASKYATSEAHIYSAGINEMYTNGPTPPTAPSAPTTNGRNPDLSPNSLLVYVGALSGARWSSAQPGFEAPPVPVVAVAGAGEAHGVLRLSVPPAPATNAASATPPAAPAAPAPAVAAPAAAPVAAPPAVAPGGKN